TIILETLQVLQVVAKTNRVRVVYSPVPGRWTDWKCAADGVEVRTRDEWPVPEKRTSFAHFDAENEGAGYVSVPNNNEKARTALELMAPEIWSALLLRSAVDRVQKSAISETELVRATLRARDEERRHIARELHDDLGQSLASLRLGIKWAEDQIRNKKE